MIKIKALKKINKIVSRRTFNTLEALNKKKDYKTPNFINGEFIESKTQDWIELLNPATQELLTKVPETTDQELREAVDTAQEAFKEWKKTSILKRQKIMLDYQKLIRDDMDNLATLVTLEQGKTFADAKGDVLREVVETLCGLPDYLLGKNIEVSKDMDTYNIREPLGVCAGICPFNFPAMIPLWMFPVAIAAGNTMIIKPSEKDPQTTLRLIELANNAGVPKGVVNVIHGGKKAVKFICEEPKIKAISFVGSDVAGKYIYETGSRHGKRVQANLGAKNHAIISPDSSKAQTISQLTGACFGAAGQRCMALSVAIFVGKTQDWIPELVENAKKLKVGGGFEKDVDIGPLISSEALKRAESIITKSIEQGAKLLLDGRGIKLSGPYQKGNFIGPTILDECTVNMECYKEEIFAPVLTILRVNTLNEAISLINKNKYGNGVSLFTQSGYNAKQFVSEIEAGQVGINVPIPVPLPMFSFTGNKGSFLGNTNFYGREGLAFYTQLKTVTQQWPAKEDENSEVGSHFIMPTHS